MANKMSEEAVKRLEKDVSIIIRLAKRKDGTTGDEICKAIGIASDFMSYRYRQAIKAAMERGVYREGHGKGSRWKR